MTIGTFIQQPAPNPKNSRKTAVTSGTPELPSDIPDLSSRMRSSIALQREYNAALREMLELQIELLALESLKRRAEAGRTPRLFLVPEVS